MLVLLAIKIPARPVLCQGHVKTDATLPNPQQKRNRKKRKRIVCAYGQYCFRWAVYYILRPNWKKDVHEQEVEKMTQHADSAKDGRRAARAVAMRWRVVWFCLFAC